VLDQQEAQLSFVALTELNEPSLGEDADAELAVACVIEQIRVANSASKL
jgi:hypothetical protein